MNWVQRKIYLYNVTFGLYMLDWWERFLFNTLMVVLLWFVCYNGFRYSTEFLKSIFGNKSGVHGSISKRHTRTVPNRTRVAFE